jgi:citrate synthase
MTENILNGLKNDLILNNTVNQDAYKKFEVKRGLRNADGSGVLAGLSHISSVVGFHKIEGDMIPVDGVLKLRGIPLDELISQFKVGERYCFEKVCFLLLVGRLPSTDEFEAFLSYIRDHRELPESVIENVIKGLPSKDIMNKLQTGVAALFGFDESANDLDPLENFFKAARLLAQMPLVIATSYLAAYKDNPTYVTPRPDMSIAEAFLYVLNEGKEPTAEEAHILDICLILHAEHGGGNNSTFATYVVTSSGSDIYSTLAAAIGSLKGPLHGSANKKVMDMMADIKAHVDNWTDRAEVVAYLKKIMNKEAHDKSGKIFGLGHAVYTKSDPRAVVIKALANTFAKERGKEDEMTLYNIISEEGPAVFQEAKGSDKVISPNVDFYSGFVYTCLGIPEEIYTPIFAMSRACGWCAHRIEETLSGKRIIRPGYKFIQH